MEYGWAEQYRRGRYYLALAVCSFADRRLTTQEPQPVLVPFGPAQQLLYDPATWPKWRVTHPAYTVTSRLAPAAPLAPSTTLPGARLVGEQYYEPHGELPHRRRPNWSFHEGRFLAPPPIIGDPPIPGVDHAIRYDPPWRPRLLGAAWFYSAERLQLPVIDPGPKKPVPDGVLTQLEWAPPWPRRPPVAEVGKNLFVFVTLAARLPDGSPTQVSYEPTWLRTPASSHPSYWLAGILAPTQVQVPPRPGVASWIVQVAWDPPWPKWNPIHPAFQTRAGAELKPALVPTAYGNMLEFEYLWRLRTTTHPAFLVSGLAPAILTAPSFLPEGVPTQITYEPPWPRWNLVHPAYELGLGSALVRTEEPRIRLPEGVDLSIRYDPPWPRWNIIHPAYQLPITQVPVILPRERVPEGVALMIEYNPPWPTPRRNWLEFTSWFWNGTVLLPIPPPPPLAAPHRFPQWIRRLKLLGLREAHGIKLQ